MGIGHRRRFARVNLSPRFRQRSDADELKPRHRAAVYRCGIGAASSVEATGEELDTKLIHGLAQRVATVPTNPRVGVCDDEQRIALKLRTCCRLGCCLSTPRSPRCVRGRVG